MRRLKFTLQIALCFCCLGVATLVPILISSLLFKNEAYSFLVAVCSVFLVPTLIGDYVTLPDWAIDVVIWFGQDTWEIPSTDS